MKVGGLATGGLLGASGLGRAGSVGPAPTEDLSSVDPTELAVIIMAYLFYGDSGITGDSVITTIGGVDVTEASALWAVDWTMEASAGRAGNGGTRTAPEVVVAKQVDRASPLLYERFNHADPLAEATILFFRADPSTGETQHYFTLDLADVQITGVRFAAQPAGDLVPHVDLFEFTPERMTVTDELNATETVIE